MARNPICPYCNKEITKDEARKEYKKRKYHLACYKKTMQEKYQTSQDQLEPKEDLYKYICEICKVEEVPSMIVAQISKYMSENPSWKYSGIKWTIKYAEEIEKQNLAKTYKTYGVGFLPYKYEKAKEYYLNIRQINSELEEQLKNKTLEDFITQKVVKVKSPNYSNKDLIDIENL